MDGRMGGMGWMEDGRIGVTVMDECMGRSDG